MWRDLGGHFSNCSRPNFPPLGANSIRAVEISGDETRNLDLVTCPNFLPVTGRYRACMHDRRFEPRHSAHEVVELRWEASGSTHECPGFLRNLSRSGARVESERPIGVHTPVQITVRNQKITAHVTFCTQTPTGFLVGVEMDSASRGLLMTPNRTRSL